MRNTRFNDNVRYVEWIARVVGDCRWALTDKGFWHLEGSVGQTEEGEPLIQRCDVVAPMMAAAFPELKVVKGAYKGKGTRGCWMYHVWCVDAQAHIVDPTGRQFDEFKKVDSFRKGNYRKAG